MAYDIDFLGNGVKAPLPTFGPELAGDIVRSSNLRDEIYADYPTFSLVMNSRYRSAAFVALNIDQSKLGGRGKKRWAFDTRISNNFQLNNDYYRQNVWDRGHMARRASAAWGNDQSQRDRNSRETYYWTNAALQHQWLNPDEWLGVEEWVRTLDDDLNNRVCSISGPIYSEIQTSIQPNGRTPAAVPNAFFKVVMFRHRDSPDRLSVRAFIVPQDAETMRANNQYMVEDLQTYQVPVRLIEQQTGLAFPDEVVQANPLFFEDREGAAGVGNPELPEVREVDVDVNIIDPGQSRPPQGRGSESIKIASAMVNPSEPEREKEWVSLINIGVATVSLQNWKMTDHLGRVCNLQGDIEPGVAIRVQPVAEMQLRNKNGSIVLTNSNGERVDRAFWIEAETRQENVPVVFMNPQRFEGPPPQ